MPKGEIRPGYLLTALTHPTLGRPLVIRNAYGTSIPHLDPADVSDIPVVRFPTKWKTPKLLPSRSDWMCLMTNHPELRSSPKLRPS